LFKRETLSGEFLQINRYLVTELKTMGLWNEEVRNEIKLAEGSIQDIAAIPPTLKEIYRTVWEIPMRSLVDMGADRGAFIDQSASLNLFMESPTIGKLSSMYMYAWKKGIKTTYYLRSRAKTGIKKTTIDSSSDATNSGSTSRGVMATGKSAASSLAGVAASAALANDGARAESSEPTAPTKTVPELPPLPDLTQFNLVAAAETSYVPEGYTVEAAVACSLENPESCEACQ
jgi:ribonucleotide reductase alpha subunit